VALANATRASFWPRFFRSSPSNAIPVVRLRAISGIFDQHYNGGTAFFSDALPASRYCALC